MLPPFQLHTALGACEREKVDYFLKHLIQHGIIGQRLSLDLYSLSALAPIMQEPKQNEESSNGAYERHQRCITSFGAIINHAKEVAGQLNESLSKRLAAISLDHKHKSYVRQKDCIVVDSKILAQIQTYKTKIDDSMYSRADAILKEANELCLED